MGFQSDVPALVAGKLDISFGSETLHDPALALGYEWLVTNAIGGYASGTLATANTRRYHGLLMAALCPPVARALLLSKLEETIIVKSDVKSVDMASERSSNTQSFTGSAQRTNVTRHALSTNVYPGSLYPQGYTSLSAWHSFPVPTWRWTLAGGVSIEKQIWMARGQNTTYVAYRLVQAPAGHDVQIDLTPLVAWRDYHSHMVACSHRPPALWSPHLIEHLIIEHLISEDDVNAGAHTNTRRARLTLTLPPIQRVTDTPVELTLTLCTQTGMAFPTPGFAPHPDWYYRFQHPREEERGLDHQEDLYSPGTLSVALLADNPLVVVISSEREPEAPQAAWDNLLAKQFSLVMPRDFGTGAIQAPDSFALRLALASDAFVVEVPGERTSIMAGYPWFTDWGRDTMIALPGLCLTTGRTQLAREILISFAAHTDRGMLPNRFPDATSASGSEKIESKIEYNTVDATLWYVVAIYRYMLVSQDDDGLREHFWPVLESIVGWHRRGTRYNIHVDPADHLLAAGEAEVQLTWMDARVGDHVITPRIGKPVEINALWYNVLRIMAVFAHRIAPSRAEEYQVEAETVRSRFVAGFARPDGLGLYDVLPLPGSSDAPDASIRPNQIFALSLPFPVVDPASELARQILDVVRRELVTPCGLRTLSPHAPGFRPRYEGGVWERDTAYHQGTVWPWLLGPYAEACYNVERDRNGALAILSTLAPQMETLGIGSLAEIFDATDPQIPRGCIAQAWSVAETLRVLARILDESASE